jgi:hypothetical protein
MGYRRRGKQLNVLGMLVYTVHEDYQDKYLKDKPAHAANLSPRRETMGIVNMKGRENR